MRDNSTTPKGEECAMWDIILRWEERWQSIPGRLPTQHTVGCRKRACKAGPKGRGFGRRYYEGKCRLCHVGGEFRLQHGLGQRGI
jgi:hypothetical protein